MWIVLLQTKNNFTFLKVVGREEKEKAEEEMRHI